MDSKVFGDRVRYYRILRGWEQEELARRIGKSIATVSRIENGAQNFTFGIVFALARALEVPPSAFFFEEGQADITADLTLLLLLFRFSRQLPDPVLKTFVALAGEVSGALSGHEEPR